MGWFNEQIHERAKHDKDEFSDAFSGMSDALWGGHGTHANSTQDVRSMEVIGEILTYYHAKISKIPERITDFNLQLEYYLRPSGIMNRDVLLTGDWYKSATGAMLGYLNDGRPIALIPKSISKYSYFDYEKKMRITVDRSNAKNISKNAICFYKPFSQKRLEVKDLVKYILTQLSLHDCLMMVLSTMLVTFVAIFGPYANSQLFSIIIPRGDVSLILPIMMLLLGASVSTALFGTAKKLSLTQITIKASVSVQAASMIRILSLPPSFFKRYSAGELTSRMQSINNISALILETFFSTGLTGIFSLIYIGQISKYAPSLTLPATIIIVITMLFTFISTIVQTRLSKKKMLFASKKSGLIYSLVSGIQKIKLSGAERRAFSRWAESYKPLIKLEYNPSTFIKFNSTISMCISLFGTIVLYCAAESSGIQVAEYMAFSASYGLVSGAFASLNGMTATIAQIKPSMDMAKPILNEMPETSESKSVVTRLSGAIELNDVSFAYADNLPLVLDNVSLKIRSGQYIAVVGATGCGKSTLMRIMLGFETPQKGAVYFDDRDIKQMDLRSLRKNIGTVMQDGKLFQGDIYSNIVICAPWLSVKDAWEAAEIAGLADDIRAMPMQMSTLISEGNGGISGGQKQRLMIARAIAPRPRILMFDEATSALDNITQKKITEALSSLKCTRIVIAHRLSTIKMCDRIIVLENGKIAEDGSYDELITKNGVLARLVKHQRVDDNTH